MNRAVSGTNTDTGLSQGPNGHVWNVQAQEAVPFHRHHCVDVVVLLLRRQVSQDQLERHKQLCEAITKALMQLPSRSRESYLCQFLRLVCSQFLVDLQTQSRQVSRSLQDVVSASGQRCPGGQQDIKDR